MAGKIEIKKIGITKLAVDAVVNAANDRLRMGGGVCGAIFEEAGAKELQEACNRIGGCLTGSAVITPGFALPAKYIIHAVGPVWYGGHEGEEEALKSCYRKSLQLAKEYQLHSIAFPLISSGIFGYPKKAAWKAALASVQEFMRENQEYLLDVTFAVISDDSLEMGTQVLKEMEPKAKDSEILFFWRTDEALGEFSNWYIAPFQAEGISYICVEQYMMAKKALLFNDIEMYYLIMNANDPADMKGYGKQVRNFDSKRWDMAKEEIVYHACLAKFLQNAGLKEKLLGTGTALLAEASPTDKIWGIGMKASDPKASSPANWIGKNLLGKILMNVRNELQRKES